MIAQHIFSFHYVYTCKQFLTMARHLLFCTYNVKFELCCCCVAYVISSRGWFYFQLNALYLKISCCFFKILKKISHVTAINKQNHFLKFLLILCLFVCFFSFISEVHFKTFQISQLILHWPTIKKTYKSIPQPINVSWTFFFLILF